MIREATEADLPVILDLIRELAEYEKLTHIFEVTEDSLREVLFGEHPVAEALVAFYDGEPAAYAIFFHSLSTFLGRAGIYLEDLYVRPHLRGKGIGKTLFATVARIARDRKCGRMEWQVLRWNRTAIDFYEAHGAESLEGWVTMRLVGESLENVAAGES
jgi:GNAT superfamily N-acetyltransferase